MMFGLFKRKQPTLMDALIKTTYGSSPPSKSANVEEATALAYGKLLFEKIDFASVKRLAAELAAGPMPYSTHDLAVSTALHFFRTTDARIHQLLSEVQIMARMALLEWIEEGKVNAVIAKTFEDSLYTRFKPLTAQPSSSDDASGLSSAGTAYFEAAVAKADEMFAATWPWDPAWIGVISVADQLDRALGGQGKMDAIGEMVVNCFLEKKGVDYCAAGLVALHSANQSELEELMRASGNAKIFMPSSKKPKDG